MYGGKREKRSRVNKTNACQSWLFFQGWVCVCQSWLFFQDWVGVCPGLGVCAGPGCSSRAGCVCVCQSVHQKNPFRNTLPCA